MPQGLIKRSTMWSIRHFEPIFRKKGFLPCFQKILNRSLRHLESSITLLSLFFYEFSNKNIFNFNFDDLTKYSCDFWIPKKMLKSVFKNPNCIWSNSKKMDLKIFFRKNWKMKTQGCRNNNNNNDNWTKIKDEKTPDF